MFLGFQFGVDSCWLLPWLSLEGDISVIIASCFFNIIITVTTTTAIIIIIINN